MAESSRNVPSLDLLRGFESAARHLNFTKAADELFLTQSAVSRQIKSLEDRLGVRLFVRQRRGLVLTHEGDRLFRAVHGALRQMQDAVESLADRGDTRRITVTATMGFCSLWLIPRLGEFHRAFPEVDVRIAANDKVLNLDRERIDVSVRYCPAEAAPKGAIWLFDEMLTPVCSAALIAQSPTPLHSPQDLQHYVLLHLDDPENPSSWLSWSSWLDSSGARGLKPAGALRYNYFDQIVRAALAGQGVALGRLPLVQDLVNDGSLVMPFEERAATGRAYWVVQAGFARGRPEVDRFVEWIAQTATADVQTPAPVGGKATSKRGADSGKRTRAPPG